MSGHLPEQFYYLYENEDARKSVVRIDLLAFFQANPHAMDTAAGFARRLHRPLRDVAAAADALAGVGILEKIERGAHAVYRLRSVELDAEGGKLFEGSRGIGGGLAIVDRGVERDPGGYSDRGQEGEGDRHQ